MTNHNELKAAEQRIRQIQVEKESALFDAEEVDEEKLTALKEEEKNINKQFDGAGIDRPLR